jgi:hypothetical protein
MILSYNILIKFTYLFLLFDSNSFLNKNQDKSEMINKNNDLNKNFFSSFPSFTENKLLFIIPIYLTVGISIFNNFVIKNIIDFYKENNFGCLNLKKNSDSYLCYYFIQAFKNIEICRLFLYFFIISIVISMEIVCNINQLQMIFKYFLILVITISIVKNLFSFLSFLPYNNNPQPKFKLITNNQNNQNTIELLILSLILFFLILFENSYITVSTGLNSLTLCFVLLILNKSRFNFTSNSLKILYNEKYLNINSKSDCFHEQNLY